MKMKVVIANSLEVSSCQDGIKVYLSALFYTYEYIPRPTFTPTKKAARPILRSGGSYAKLANRLQQSARNNLGCTSPCAHGRNDRGRASNDITTSKDIGDGSFAGFGISLNVTPLV